jgi:hypothetical protein
MLRRWRFASVQAGAFVRVVREVGLASARMICVMSHDGDLGRILVVDDEEPVRDVLCEYFEGRGFGVAAAESALASARRVPPAAG